MHARTHTHTHTHTHAQALQIGLESKFTALTVMLISHPVGSKSTFETGENTTLSAAILQSAVHIFELHLHHDWIR